jgi:Peptidase C13 family
MRRSIIFGLLGLTIALSGSATGQSGRDDVSRATKGWTADQGHDAGWFLAQHRKMSAAMASLLPQRPGTVDAYVLAVGLDSDAVFGREAREAATVLSRRYGAIGRTAVLTTGKDEKAPQGSPANIATILAAIASKMDVKEDVLILYTTSHGNPDVGIVYRDQENSLGMIAPKRMASLLSDLGIERRIVMISACYAGVFVPELQSANSVIVTAASADRNSFGCAPGNDWTFFGDALINNALRKPQPLDKAVVEAITLINQWEMAKNLLPSLPQSSVGEKTGAWLPTLEARMPKVASAKVGKPAIDDAVPH